MHKFLNMLEKLTAVQMSDDRFLNGERKRNELAEEVGFEPTDGCPSTVFKTAAIGHSATLPQRNNNYNEPVLKLKQEIDSGTANRFR